MIATELDHDATPDAWVYGQRLARQLTRHTGVEVLDCYREGGHWIARTQHAAVEAGELLRWWRAGA